jgi:hypothetical protein
MVPSVSSLKMNSRTSSWKPRQQVRAAIAGAADQAQIQDPREFTPGDGGVTSRIWPPPGGRQRRTLEAQSEL